MLPRFAFLERPRLQLVPGCEELLYPTLRFIQSFRSRPREADALFKHRQRLFERQISLLELLDHALKALHDLLERRIVSRICPPLRFPHVFHHTVPKGRRHQRGEAPHSS